MQDLFPLSPVQQGMLFESLYRASGPYVEQPNWYVRGKLDVELLRAAWERTARRYEMLRAVCVLRGTPQPMQAIHHDGLPEFRFHDWTGGTGGLGPARVPDVDRDARVRRFLVNERDRGFDLEQPPLHRIAVVRLADDLHLLVWTHHHITTDGWSAPIVVRAVFAEYAALVRGRAGDTVPPPSYRSYVDWLGRQDWAVTEGYWRSRLAGFTTRNRYPQTVVDGDGLGTVRLRVDPFVDGQVRDRAKAGRITIGTLLQGCLATLVGVHSGDRDVVFGAVTANRPATVDLVEEIVGPFLNTVPVRVAVEPQRPMLTWLQDIQAEQARAQRHTHASLGQIQQWSDVPAGDPLFDTLLTVQNYPGVGVFGEASGLGGDVDLEVTFGVPMFAHTNYPVDLTVAASPEGMEALLIHDRGRLSDAAAEQFIAELDRLLTRFTDDPQIRLGDAIGLAATTAYRGHAPDLQARASSDEHGEAQASVYRRFTELAVKYPDRIAVDGPDGGWTFGAVAGFAARLADRLVTHGAGPETVVAVSLPRTGAIVGAALAAWACGAAFLLLDAADPVQRRATLVRQARAVCLVTGDDGADLASCAGTPFVTCPDRPVDAAVALPTDREPVRARDLAAYVVFTSGTTGPPKGVVIGHRSLLSHAQTQLAPLLAVVGDRAPLRIGSAAPVTFDAFIDQFLAVVAFGHTLVLFDADERLDPESFLRRARSTQPLDVVDCATSQLKLLLQAGLLQTPCPPRLVMFGGESVDPGTWRDLRAGAARAVNLYGATECTMHSTAAEVHDWPTPALGGPIGAAAVYVLDESLRPTSVGLRGALYIGGPGVGRGYLGHPADTARVFLPDPFAAAPGSRMYRTGDIGRVRPDGALEFCGRADGQLKVRGFRIEPDEVERAVATCPGVRSAAVVADGRGGLVCFVVRRDPGDAAEPSAEQLRRYLHSRLPAHEVPARYVFWAALPTAGSGKVDRDRLGNDAARAPSTSQRYRAPRTTLERQLCEVWQDVFGIDRVGIDDDFFDLGGHSLLAIQMVTRLAETASRRIAVRALFERRTVAGLTDELVTSVDEPELDPTPSPLHTSAHPVSHSQRRLWLLDQISPGTSGYHVAVGFRLRGAVDVDALGAALCDLVTRHEALRTVVLLSDGEPVNVVQDPPRAQPVPTVVLSTGRTPDAEAELARLSVAFAEQPFDLARGPVLRTRLFCLAADDHALLLVLHHIAVDGWSLRVIMADLPALYAARVSGTEADLPPVGLRYVDHAVRQRARLDHTPLAEREMAYWRAKLADAPTTRLPGDRVRPHASTFAGARLTFAIPGDVAHQMGVLARESAATTFMLGLTTLAALLSRYVRSSDVLVGVPTAGRADQRLEGTVGNFVNIMPARIDLAGDPTFRELLARVRDVTLDGLAHDTVPFEWLAELLPADRTAVDSGPIQILFQVGRGTTQLTAREVAHSRMWTDGLSGTVWEPPITRAPFDLTVVLHDDADEPTGRITYSTERYDEATIRRFVNGFVRLLAAAVREPDRRVAELPVVAPEERRALLAQTLAAAHDPAHGDRDGDAGAGADTGVGDAMAMFEAMVERIPQAPAVAGGDHVRSYAALNRYANQIAGWLKAHRVGREGRVAVALRTGHDEPAALLGVLKAMAAYLPLDTSHPAGRLAGILADAAPDALITDRWSVDALPHHSVPTLVLDDGRQLDGYPVGNPDRATISTDAAYIVYTSGSTGRPKGVVVGHGVLANMLRWQAAMFPAGARALSAVAPGFDLAVKQTLGTFVGGGCLMVEPGVDYRTLPQVGAAVHRHGVSVVFATPSVLSLLVQDPDFRAAQQQRTVTAFVGGEALVPDEAMRRCRLVSTYGPSETHMVAFHVVDSATTGPVPLGRAIAGAEIHLLDDVGEPVPPGMPGEVWLGGVVVGRGYLGRPKLTADRFRPDPFGTAPGARLYRTGDLARRRRDGTLEFAGRVDDQVKIHGNRVEPGEAAHLLREHPAVHDAAVLATESAGVIRLVAYLTGEPIGADELRDFLRRRLPAYAVPSRFVWLPELPLGPTGKLTRHALPAPPDEPSLPDDYQPPATELAASLAGLWQELLDVPRVGASDRFFDLGGTSLHAVRLAFAVRQRMGLTFALVDFMREPTVAGLAALLRPATPERITTLARVGDDEFPTSYAQRRMWFLHRLDPHNTTFNVFISLDVVGALDLTALGLALDALVERHEILRTTYRDRDGEPVQVVLRVGWLPLSTLDVTGADPVTARGEALRLAALDAAAPFDLTALPMARCQAVRYAADRVLVTLTLHHVVVDAWSAPVLARDVVDFYARACGRRRELAPMPMQYADFAVWQRARAVDEDALRYWEGQLSGVQRLDVPSVDRLDQPVEAESRAGRVRFRLGARLRTGVADLARRADATPFMVFLAALNAALARCAGADDIAVGVPVADRAYLGAGDMLGFCVNTVVMRTRVDPTASFHQMLDRARQTALEALRHQHVPFELVVDRVRRAGAGDVDALTQVVLSVADTDTDRLAQHWHFDGTTEVTPVELPLPQSQFDLTVGVYRDGDELVCTLSYDRWAVDDDFAQAMAGALRTTVETAVAVPDQPVGLRNANGHGPAGDTLTAVLDEVAAVYPERVAVDAVDGAYTFAELHRRSVDLAAVLRRVVSGRDQLIGICLPRDSRLPLAMAATWRAGAGFLLLDPASPDEWLHARIAGIPVRAVLTCRKFAARFTGVSCPVLSCEDAADELSSTSDWGPADDLEAAYAIFTSGSTGRPKAVVVSRADVLAHVRTRLTECYPDPAGEPLRLAGSGPVTFDIFIEQVLATLARGHTLVMLADDEVGDPARLLARVGAHPDVGGVDAVFVVTSQLAMLTELGLFAGDRMPRFVAFGAEHVPADMWRQLRETPTMVLQAYGLTECTIWSTYCAVRDHAAPALGKATGSAVVHLVDDWLEPVEVGVPGELYIGGAGVARGYAGDPVATAAGFVPDPYSRTPGARMFRTRDRVRRRANGRLEYLGRRDGQLKVRGRRIEPTEIEHALCDHRQVAAAAVVAAGQPRVAEQLVAFVTPARWLDVSDVDTELIRDWLGTRLPAHLVPDRIRAIDRFPTSPAGKVDRRLLALAASQVTTAPVTEPPTTDAERRVGVLFSRLLGVEQVNRTDDFFALGGHSMLATRLAFRLYEEFGVRLPLDAVVRLRTPAALALAVAEHLTSGTPPVPVLRRLTGTPAEPAVVLIHPLDGGLACYESLTAALAGHAAVYGIGFAPDPALAGWTELADRYAQAIRSALADRTGVVAGWSMGGVLAHAVAARLAMSGPAPRLALIDAPLPSQPGADGGAQRLVDDLGRLREELERAEPSLSDAGQRLLRNLGVDAAAFADLPTPDATELIHGWSTLVGLFHGYAPTPVDAPAVLLIATDRPAPDRDQLADEWRPWLGRCDVVEVAGDHRGVLRPPVVAEVAARIAALAAQPEAEHRNRMRGGQK